MREYKVSEFHQVCRRTLNFILLMILFFALSFLTNCAPGYTVVGSNVVMDRDGRVYSHDTEGVSMFTKIKIKKNQNN